MKSSLFTSITHSGYRDPNTSDSPQSADNADNELWPGVIIITHSRCAAEAHGVWIPVDFLMHPKLQTHTTRTSLTSDIRPQRLVVLPQQVVEDEGGVLLVRPGSQHLVDGVVVVILVVAIFQ